MTDFAIFCKSFRDDFSLLPFLFESYEKYCPARRFLLSVPKDDLSILKRDIALPRGCDLVADEDYVSPEASSLSGWLQQQVCKLSVHRLGYSEHFYTIDSDAYFISAIGDNDIIEDNKPKVFFSPISTLMDRSNARLLDYLRIGDITLGNLKYRAIARGSHVNADERLADFRRWVQTVSDPDYSTLLHKIEKVFLSPPGTCCQPGQILHASLLSEMEEYFLSCGLTIPELIKLAPWEYNWYAHWVAAAKLDRVTPSTPLTLHFANPEAVRFAQSQGFTEHYFGKVFRTIQMAARHFADRAYIDPVNSEFVDGSCPEARKECTMTPLERLRERFGPTGPANLLAKFNALYPFEGKSVFELGGHNIGRDLAIGQFGAKKWIACDFLAGASGQGNTSDTPELIGEVIVPVALAHLIDGLDHIDFAVIDGDIGRLQGFTNAFDVSISINVFEHLPNLPRALSVIERLLVPGGCHIAVWAALWSGQHGHHINRVYDGDRDSWYDMGRTVPFDPWDHLLLSASQMYEKLITRCSRDAAQEIIGQVYTSERINRYFTDDFLRFFQMSGMEIVTLEKDWIIDPPEGIRRTLVQMYPHNTDFSTNTLFAVLRKRSG